MRKTSVRRFIHAVIDVLPLLVIPIFALNILHKETEPITLNIEEPIYYDSNEVTRKEDLIIGNIYRWNDNWERDTTNAGKTMFRFEPIDFTNQQLGITQTYTIGSVLINTQGYAYVDLWNNGTYVSSVNINSNIFDFILMNYVEENIDLGVSHITYSGVKYVKNYEITTYNNTDIGSQFIYALYKPVHDYFNFNNLFNMGAIYDWIQLNLFSGTAPLPIFIIWNVIVYEFFVDLIFLLYGVFMFIIDFAEKCLERPFRR